MSLRRTVHRLLGISCAGLIIGCSGDTSTSPPHVDQPQPTTAQIKVVNYYTRDLYYVYFTSCQSATWGSDRLNSAVISAGGSYTWTISAGCWDAKMVASDNKTWTHMGENISAGNLLTLTVN